MSKPKLIRITTVPISLSKLLRGQMRYMSNYYEVIGISSGGTVLEEVSKREQIRVKPLEMSRRVDIIHDIRSLIQMYKFLKKEKPQIVHTHTPKAGTIGMLAAWLARVPIRMHTVAGMPLLIYKGFKRRILNIVERLTYKCATKVYPNSHALKNIIIKEKLAPASKLNVLANGSSNGIDTNHFSPTNFTEKENEKLSEKLNISKSDFIFIFTGRLVRDKGINELIAAFARIKAKDVKLLLVGPFEEELDPLLPKTLSEIKNNRNIISVGWQEDVRPYLAVSDALVFPSYREGFPNVVMQAGAMGLPSIVTDINGCNEIIIDGENGIIIPPQDEKSLFNAMVHFLENKDKVRRMADNSRKMISDRYEQHIVWEAILAEYRRLEKEFFENKK